jgi:hypothetical protein
MGDDGKQKRSGSQKRKVTARIAINCTPTQKAAIMERANAAGLSPTAICLAMLLDAPLPKRRRPTVKDQAMTSYLAATAKVADALRGNLAELGKSGSNLNQVAYMLNAGADPARIMNIIESAVEEHRAALAKLNETMTDALEIRTMAMEALGLER